MSSPPYQANKTGVTSMLKQKDTSDREQDDGALIGGLVGGLLLLSLILTIIAFIIRRHKSAKPPTTSLPVRKTTATSVSQSDLPSAPTTTSVVATTSSLRTATIATSLRSSVDGVNSPPPHLYIDLDTSHDHTPSVRPVPDEWSPVTVIRVSPSLSTLESDGNNKDCTGKRIAGNNLDVIGDNRNGTHQGHVRSLGNGRGSVGDGAGDKASGQSQLLFNFLGVKGKSSPRAASDGRVERSTIHESGSPRKTGDGDEADHSDDPGRRYALPHDRRKHSSLVNYVNLDVTDVGAGSDFRTGEDYLGSGSSIEKLSLSPEFGATNSFTGQRSRSSSLNTDPTTLTQISLVQRGSIFRTETSGALDRNIELPGGVSFNDCCISLRPEHSKDHPANEAVEMLTQSKVPPLYRRISEKANLGQKTPGTQHLSIPSQQHLNTRNKEMSSSLSQLSTKNESTGILQQLNKICKRYKARSDSSYAYRHNRKDSAETYNTATGYLESGTPPLQTDVHSSPRKAGDLFATQEACQPHPLTPALPSPIKFSENSQSRPTCGDKDVHPTKEKQTHGAESNPGTDATPGPEAETVDQALAVSEEIPKDHLPPHDLATLRRHYSLPFSLFPTKRKSVSQTSSFPLAMLRFDDGYLADWDFHDQNQMSRNSKDRRIGRCHFTPPGNVYEKAVTKSATKPSATESLVFSTCSTFADNRRWAMDGEAVKKANVLSQSTKDTFKYPTSAHAKGLESYENYPDEKVANINDEMATRSSDSRSLDVAADCRSKMTAEAHDGRDKKALTRNQRPTGDISHLTQSPNHDLLEKEVHKESPEALMSSVRSDKTSVNERYLATGLGGCNQAVASPELHTGTLSPASVEADHKSHINGSSNESLDTVHRRGFPLENVCVMNDSTSGPATTTLIDLDETTDMKSFRNNITKTDSLHRNVFGADTESNSVPKTSASGHDKGGQDSQNSKMKSRSRSKTEECDSAKDEIKNTHKVEKTEISFHSFKKHCPASPLSRLVHSSSPIQNSPHSPDLNVWKKNLNIDYPLSPLVLPLSRIMSTHQSSASMLPPKVISRRPALFTSKELWEEPNNYLRQQSVFSRHMNSLNTSQCVFNNRSRARPKVPTGIHKLSRH